MFRLYITTFIIYIFAVFLMVQISEFVFSDSPCNACDSSTSRMRGDANEECNCVVFYPDYCESQCCVHGFSYNDCTVVQNTNVCCDARDLTGETLCNLRCYSTIAGITCGPGTWYEVLSYFQDACEYISASAYATHPNKCVEDEQK